MSELNEILEALDLESYLDHMGVEYRTRPGSSGRQLNIKTCPSCGDNSWKVYANESTGLGNCFKGSCSLGTFNKYKFIRALLGDPAHREVIAHIKESATTMGWRARKSATAVEYTGNVELPPSIELPDAAGENLEYLERRGVTGDLARFFHLRYCHSGGFKMDVGRETYRQDYSGRVIIPVFDLEGNLRTFQGRDITGTKEPKYLFPPGLNASGKYLYNGHNAWQSSHIVVGEGAFDVMAIHAALQEEPELRAISAVGTFGMHLSAGYDGDTQIDAFSALKADRLRAVTIMWDSEPAALRAAIKAAEALRGIGLSVTVAILPKGKDPNEVPGYVIRERLAAAVNPFDGAGSKELLKAIMLGTA